MSPATAGIVLCARVALGVLFLVFGAGVDAVHLVVDPDSFVAFGEMSSPC